MPSSLTIRSLAQHLGISKSTVHRALSGLAGISPKLRERVLETANQMGYRPDPLFSILGSQCRKHRKYSIMLAYLTGSPKQQQGHVTCGAGVNIFDDLKCRAAELGYGVDQLSLDELDAGKRLMKVLYHRGYVGVIIGPNIRTSAHPAILANTQLPVVCCGRIDGLPLHTVQPDAPQIMRLAWTKMLEAGYRRIGGAIGTHTPVIMDDSDRLGTLLALQEETLEKRGRVPPYRGGISDSKAIVEWFQKYKPEGIIGFSVGNYFSLTMAGIDMRKVGFCCLHSSRTPETGIIFSGVIENNQSVARETVNLLDSLIRHRSVGIPEEPIHFLLPGGWVEGETLPPKKVTYCRSRSRNASAA